MNRKKNVFTTLTKQVISYRFTKKQKNPKHTRRSSQRHSDPTFFLVTAILLKGWDQSNQTHWFPVKPVQSALTFDMSIHIQNHSVIQITQVYSRCSSRRLPSDTLFRQECHTSGQAHSKTNNKKTHFWKDGLDFDSSTNTQIFSQGMESRRIKWRIYTPSTFRVWTEKNLSSILSSLFPVLFKASKKTLIFCPTFPCSGLNFVLSASV